MRISEYKNEDALELLADLLEPVTTILADPDIANVLKGKGTKMDGIKLALKSYKTEIIQILARLNDVSPENYSANIAEMIKQLLDLLNDKELIGFFTSQEQTEVTTFSGAVTESTKEKGK